jgi:hypothetical protein
MLDKEEAFLVNEFIRKHATRNLWEVSDKLYKLIAEIKKDKDEAADQSQTAPA